MKDEIWKDSPVDKELKEYKRGDRNWKGWESVYDRINKACHDMAINGVCLTDLHVEAMAALGSGHEERMKSMLWKLRLYGWIK